MNSYDVVIVGGGPGGYVAALRSAKEGYKTALVESQDLGGTCLNRGCIPSKTLLEHAKVIEQIEKAKSWGIYTENLSFSLTEMMDRKLQVIQTLRGGIEHLLKSAQITVYDGYGTIHQNRQVTVKTNSGDELQISGEKIIIATGSQPSVPPIPGLEKGQYHTTDSIFDITEIPKSIVIIGGGVIGVELANIFNSLKTKVTIIELGDRLIPTEDVEAAKALLKIFKKKGIQVVTKAQVSSVEFVEGQTVVHTKLTSGKPEKFQVETILVATGRKANLQAIRNLSLNLDRGNIVVDDYYETSEKNIFAVGDVIGKLQLAHAASAEGLAAVANLHNKHKKIDYRFLPRCIYTNPQIASVGLSEDELIKSNTPYQVKTFSFAANGKALTMGETEGFTKVMIDEKYGEILGVVMMGAGVTEMISQSTAYMYLEGTIDELADMVQPHPSLSETLLETANMLIGKAIHN